MNRGACGSFWITVLSSYALRGEVAGSYSSSVFGFLRNLCTVLHRGCTDSHSHQSHQRLPFQQKYFLCICKFNCKSNLSTLLHRQKSRFLQRTTSHGIFSREVLRQKFCSHCTRSREESMSHNYFSLEPETAKICKRGEILLESKTGKKKKESTFRKAEPQTMQLWSTARQWQTGPLRIHWQMGLSFSGKALEVDLRQWLSVHSHEL